MTATLIFGLGVTGYSCVKHLVDRDAIAVYDTRDAPPGLARMQADFPGVERLDDATVFARLNDFDRVVVSPGVALEHCLVTAARQRGLAIESDISLFFESVQAPVVGITGTNGKSTVTTVVGDLLAKELTEAHVGVGGNLGVPALELLDPNVERYVLELSSFQLERLSGAHFDVASCLNVTPDHLDRHPSFAAYADSKRSIYADYRVAVYDSKDPLTVPPQPARGIDVSQSAEWRLADDHLSICGRELPVDALPLKGRHNAKNMLMAAAAAHLCGVSIETIVDGLTSFSGLAHRCVLVARRGEVEFINDSKATNVGATVAALEGLGDGRRRVILIAGGDGKGAAFDDLVPVAGRYVRQAFLLGQDAGRLQATLEGSVACSRAADMDEAVAMAAAVARPGDLVLLSPACASFDMFDNFEARGEAFEKAVLELDLARR